MNWLKRLLRPSNPADGYGVDKTKPVRCGGGPPGERAYLDRLRCPAGRAVKYRRRGAVMALPKPVDEYIVECGCGGHALSVYVDMYAQEAARPIGVTGWRLA